MVCRLRKSLYGLKQASRCWNECLTQHLKRYNLKPLYSDTCVFVSNKGKIGDNFFLIICIYVDDGIIISKTQAAIDGCILHLRSEFEVTIGNNDCFVGLQIHRGTNETVLHQSCYVEKVINKFEMNNCRGFSTPMNSSLKLTKAGTHDIPSKPVEVPYLEAIGSLLYCSIATRFDICFATSLLSRFCNSPTLAHWNAVKRVLAYLKLNSKFGLVFKKSHEFKLEAYSDADWAGCLDDRKSTSGILLTINRTPVIWKSSKQKTVATSTCEAEYIAAAQAVRELLWLKNFVNELGIKVDLINLYIDNQGAIKNIVNNQVSHKTEHIDINLHFMKDRLKKDFIVEYLPTDQQLADIFTKPLAYSEFNSLICQLNSRRELEASNHSNE